MSPEPIICWKCGATLSLQDFNRGDTCPKCRLDTRCCKNCVHYDRQSYNECREPSADRVVEKEKANFCDYFRPGNHSVTSPADAAKAAAEALFGNLGKK